MMKATKRVAFIKHIQFLIPDNEANKKSISLFIFKSKKQLHVYTYLFKKLYLIYSFHGNVTLASIELI